ncbi:MAG: hypothetical protein L6R00_07160 [Phycisphaerae bacterium]|nr:hypothetical protein [Phycisphaerae bacterium]
MKRLSLGRRAICAISIVVLPVGQAAGWNERGHAIITRLAVAGLPADVPGWVREPRMVDRLAYLSNEPDRWRGTKLICLAHLNEPDHFIDVEHLAPYGMSLKTLPSLRYDFVGKLAAQRALHPDRFVPERVGSDPKMLRLTPGMLPYRIAELHAEIVSGWSTLQTFEANTALCEPGAIEAARERIIHAMGLLSHYVGDAAQPLHTTEHYNGWVGANPNGYTTDKGFHRFIDDGVLTHHGLTSRGLLPSARTARDIAADKVWEETLEHIDRSHRAVEALYKLEKSGELKGEAGRVFIEERLLDAGSMLAGVWASGYHMRQTDAYLTEWLKSPQRRDAPASSLSPPSSQAAE